MLATAFSLSQFQTTVTKDSGAEIALLFVVRANWFKHSPILGIAQCRRTYCHHLVLEFLAVHPSIVGQFHPRVAGVGKGLIYGLAEIANQTGVELKWGRPPPIPRLFIRTSSSAQRSKTTFSLGKRCWQDADKHFATNSSANLIKRA